MKTFLLAFVLTFNPLRVLLWEGKTRVNLALYLKVKVYLSKVYKLRERI